MLGSGICGARGLDANVPLAANGGRHGTHTGGLAMEHTPATHDVFNQTPPLADYNLFASDRALQEAIRREGAGAATSDLVSAGAALGTAANFEDARLANRYP